VATEAVRPEGLSLVFEDDFDGPELDPGVWVPHYLPAWSSRAATAATFEIRDSCLHLTIPPDQSMWCADDHQPPLRVSGIQSGNFSGPVGSTLGQQPYRDGVTVREEQRPSGAGRRTAVMSSCVRAAWSHRGPWWPAGW
jgi:hypothetical protein